MASMRFEQYLSQIHLAELRAKTAPHGGAAREMKDHGLPRGGQFEMSKLPEPGAGGAGFGFGILHRRLRTEGSTISDATD